MHEGRLCVVHPAPGAQAPGETEDDFISRLLKKDIPRGATQVTVVEERDLPKDRLTRDKWNLRDGKVVDK